MSKKMKVIFLTLAFYCLSTMVFSQGITLNVSNVTVREAIQMLKEKTGYSFAYEVDDLDSQRRISIKTLDKSIDEVVKQILIGQNVNYSINGKNIIIISKGKKSTSGFLNNTKQKKITGLVTDEKGVPVIGASVVVKGMSLGTVTDLDGAFTLQAPEKSSFVVSYIGFKSETKVISESNNYKIILTESARSLDEVVVVGYGTQQRSNITGAISTINSKKFENLPSPNFEKALQGNAPGLQISSSNASPEGGSRILIRGTGSITAGTEPLIIVDGVPLSYGSLTFLSQINPNDIDNVSVLKDASSAAIYGSRGGNGVILVTTKSGKKGTMNISYSYDVGYMSPINTMPQANTSEWKNMVENARANANLPIDNATMNAYYSDQLFNPNDKAKFISQNIYGTVENDWFSQVIKNGSYQQHGFNASNANENSNYYISAQYRTQIGNFIGEKYDKYNVRMNLSFKPMKFIEIALKNNFSFQDINKRNVVLNNGATYTKQNTQELLLNPGAFGTWSQLYGISIPIYPTYWPGTSEPFDRYGGTNIVYSNINNNSQKNNKYLDFISNASISLTPIKNLVIKGELGVNYDIFTSKMWASDRIRYNGIYKKSDGTTYAIDDPLRWVGQNFFETKSSNTLEVLMNSVVSYSLTLNKKHNLSLLAGIESIQTYNLGSNITTMQGTMVARPEVESYPTDASYTDVLPKMLSITNGMGDDQRFYSYFMRAGYDFDNKYLFQTSLRRDGSSKFSPSNRFALFPSLSAGYILSNEPFYDLKWMNFLKFKASWGKTGNAAIPGFGYFNTFNKALGAFAGTYISPMTKIGSSSIRWEQSNTTDVGIDFGFLKNRISGSLGYYYKLTTDMLLDIPLPLSAGTALSSSTLGNVGKLSNQGVEFSISTVNIDKKRFSWRTDYNISTNKNRIEELYPGFKGSSPSQLSSNGNTAVLEGEPIGTFYLPMFAGYDDKGYSTVYEIDQTKKLSYVYEKTENVVRGTDNNVSTNRVLLKGKTGIPTFYGGLTNTFTYDNFSLSVLLTYQGGNYVLDAAPGRSVNLGTDWIRKEMYNNYWTSTNVNSKYPVLTWNNKDDLNQNVNMNSDKWLKKGDFIRIKNISLNYSLPKGVLKKILINSMSVYVNLDNLATFSYLKGFDPELVSGGDEKSRNTTQGILTGIPYFQVFTASAGVKVSF